MENHGRLDVSVIQRMRDEVWKASEILFGTLNPETKDILGVCNSWIEWRNFFGPDRFAWMLAHVMPLCIGYLSKDQILKSRLVCKRWYYVINYFCENNAARRPAYGGEEKKLSLRMDFIQKAEHTKHGFKIFHSDWISMQQTEKFLREASDHAQNPIVGRCVMVAHCRNPGKRHQYECELGNRFLKKFGRHILFLQVNFYDTEPVEFLKSFVELFKMADLSNLKSLEIKNETKMVTKCDCELSQIRAFITNLTWKQKKRFPRHLETFISDVVGDYQIDLNNTFVEFFKDSLRTLDILKDTFTHTLNFQFLQLCDLRINVESRGCLQGLMRVTSPIRRLKLTVKIDNRLIGSVTFVRLIKTINSFKDSLRFLKIKLCLNDCRFDVLEPYLNENDLDVPNLKTVVCDYSLLSFNFISGLTSVEYLHIDGVHMYELHAFNDSSFVEKLDICQLLKDNYNKEKEYMKHPNFYDSNLWNIFKRSKVITINVHEQFGQAPVGRKYERM